jgi:hypothetical protein
MTDLDVTTDALVAARTSVHGLAEQVFAAAARAATGSIRLFVRDGTLSTPDLPSAGGPGRPPGSIRLQLAGGFVVRRPDGLTVPFHGPLGDLARTFGVEFGLVDPPYPPASGCGPDHVVDADQGAVELILDAWRVGDTALRRFDADQQPVVWPEHLDVAITAGSVNYGVSPGDGFLPRPYAYVGPHEPRTGPFWNAPFGAARLLHELDGVQGVLEFFRQGRAAAA